MLRPVFLSLSSSLSRLKCLPSLFYFYFFLRLQESPEPDRSSIYRSLVVNTSKEMMCFSDFPMPDDYPNYMHNSQLLQYFRLYAAHFHLLQHIRFQVRPVLSVTQRPDFSVSGQWDVVTMNKNNEEEIHIFDAVLMCSGHYTHPVLPLSDFLGHETFLGRLLHSREYRDADSFRGERVVVVGFGNSGGDVAVEISRSAEKTFLSVRDGFWVMSRMAHRGLPVDMTLISRFNILLLQLLPKTLINWAAERALNQKYDHELYGLKPRHRPLVNDDLPGRILQGALVIKPNIRAFKDSGVTFEDGTVEDNIDSVVFCTGYKGIFPFLPSALSEGPHSELTLYKRVFPPSLQQPTLAVMGFFQVRGPIMPIVEMQVRWAVKKSKKFKRYVYHSVLQVDFIQYLDFMAEEIGVKPHLWRLLLTDPVLWAKIFFGPCTPYQYRLTGPGQWAGARQAILTQWERVAKPFRSRALPEPEVRRSFPCSPWLTACAGTMVMALLLSHKIVPLVQRATQMLSRSKSFLGDLWFTD
uniref:Flavin-containing monooxygenase n=1 Tax=Xiphophorus maculatus TaxID=8083 RepID=A0A3B5Q5S6_XIPMA